jgi:hypothetical protein
VANQYDLEELRALVSYNRLKQRDRRARLKAAGLCYDCTKPTHDPSSTRCENCKAEARTLARRSYMRRKLRPRAA